MQIVWKDPPARVSRSTWAERLAPLVEHPGRWAMIQEGTLSRINGLRSRLVRVGALRGHYEFRTHKVSDDSSELYARYVG